MNNPIKDMRLTNAPGGDVTQWFGENPELYSRWGMLYHNGIDLVRAHGEPMFAIENATVVEVKNDPNGFGKHVRLISLDADKSGYCREWTYGHCSMIFVQQNDVVKGGEHIANMGNTGFVVSGATPFWKVNPYAGTHLHLGLRRVKLGTKSGWKYPGSNLPKMTVKDYENGVRGAIDPVPYLNKSKPNHQLDNLKQQASLLQKAVELLSQLVKLRKDVVK